MIRNVVQSNSLIVEKFNTIINSEEFLDLKSKLQFDLPFCLNATYARFSIYYLVCRFVSICKKKLSNTLSTLEEEEQIIQCFDFVRMIGDGCTSDLEDESIDVLFEIKTLENVFGKLIRNATKMFDWDMTETDMRHLYQYYLEEEDYIQRYVELFSTQRVSENILYRELDHFSHFVALKSQFFSLVPELALCPECVFESSGKEKYAFGIDLVLLECFFITLHYPSEKIISILDQVKSIMASEEQLEISNDSFFLQEGKTTQNSEVYYDDDGILESYHVHLRRSGMNGSYMWIIEKDGQVDEISFSSFDGAVFFLQHEWGIPISQLNEQLILHTKCTQYSLSCSNGTFEFAFDETIPEFKDRFYPSIHKILWERQNDNFEAFRFLSQNGNLSKKDLAIQMIRELSHKRRGMSRIRVPSV